MDLTAAERETIINYNEAEQTAQRITQEQAEADRRAAEGLKHYL